MEGKRCTAIVLAGGSGKRMGASSPKQYLPLGEHSVLYEALTPFENSPLIDEIVVVCAREDLAVCREKTERPGSKITHLVEGGKERYDSVYAGLLSCPEAKIVLIHDGARPLCDEAIIERCVKGAEMYGACAAGMPSKDTVKLTDEAGQVVSTPQRSRVWIVQTPQAFRYDIILHAHEELRKTGLAGVTDDAMMVERAGKVPVYMVEGSYGNIKLTTPEDLILAKALLNQRKI